MEDIIYNGSHFKSKYLKLKDSYLKTRDYSKFLKKENKELDKRVKIGNKVIEKSFERLEGSYNKLLSYNQKLEKKLNLKIKELEQSFEREAQSIYRAAVIGGITQPVLHDIASPLSALDAIFKLLKNEVVDFQTKKELLKRGESATIQAIQILMSAKELMHNKKTQVITSPQIAVEQVVFVLKDLLYKNEIEVKINVAKNIKITTFSGLLERVISNLLLNAIQELAQCHDRDRYIHIDGFGQDDYFILRIKDNGRGIPKKYLKKVFDNNFSLKSGENYGFGLAFVKKIIEQEFSGEVKIESRKNEFTEFTLRLKK